MKFESEKMNEKIEKGYFKVLFEREENSNNVKAEIIGKGGDVLKVLSAFVDTLIHEDYLPENAIREAVDLGIKGKKDYKIEEIKYENTIDGLIKMLEEIKGELEND